MKEAQGTVGTFDSYNHFKAEVDALDNMGDENRSPENEARYQLLVSVETFTQDRTDLLPLFAEFTREGFGRIENALVFGDLDDAVSSGAEAWSKLNARDLATLLVILRVPRDKLREALDPQIARDVDT